MRRPCALGCMGDRAVASLPSMPGCRGFLLTACRNRSAPVVPPPPLNRALEWVMGLQRVSASQNSPAPLGPNTLDFCTAGSNTFGCSALVDIGTFSIGTPPQLFLSLLQLLGLPPTNPPLVGVNITGRTLISDAGYPQINCESRLRPGPTIDFQIQVRSSMRICTIASAKDRGSPWHPYPCFALSVQPYIHHPHPRAATCKSASPGQKHAGHCASSLTDFCVNN